MTWRLRGTRLWTGMAWGAHRMQKVLDGDPTHAISLEGSSHGHTIRRLETSRRRGGFGYPLCKPGLAAGDRWDFGSGNQNMLRPFNKDKKALVNHLPMRVGPSHYAADCQQSPRSSLIGDGILWDFSARSSFRG